MWIWLYYIEHVNVCLFVCIHQHADTYKVFIYSHYLIQLFDWHLKRFSVRFELDSPFSWFCCRMVWVPWRRSDCLGLEVDMECGTEGFQENESNLGNCGRFHLLEDTSKMQRILYIGCDRSTCDHPEMIAKIKTWYLIRLEVFCQTPKKALKCARFEAFLGKKASVGLNRSFSMEDGR